MLISLDKDIRRYKSVLHQLGIDNIPRSTTNGGVYPNPESGSYSCINLPAMPPPVTKKGRRVPKV